MQEQRQQIQQLKQNMQEQQQQIQQLKQNMQEQQQQIQQLKQNINMQEEQSINHAFYFMCCMSAGICLGLFCVKSFLS